MTPTPSDVEWAKKYLRSGPCSVEGLTEEIETRCARFNSLGIEDRVLGLGREGNDILKAIEALTILLKHQGWLDDE